MPEPFRVAFVVGVTPDKWVRRWRERRPDPLEVFLVADAEQTAVLADGRAHMSLVRTPVDRAGLHLIPLYEERPVAVVHREHPAAAYDELAAAELAGELHLDPADPRVAVETVAAGTGLVVLPASVARVHHRRDVVAVPLTGLPPTQVGLAWPVEADDDRVEAFVGIVRGRTANSSRGGPAGAPARRRRRRRA